MIARSLVLGLVLVTAVVLQTTLFAWLTLLGFRPDLLLLVVVAVGLHDGSVPGLRVGLAAGLLADLLVSQAPAGLYVLIYTIIGHGVGVARPYLAPGSFTAPIMIAFASGAAGTAAYGMMTLLLGDDRIDVPFVMQASLTVALYNTLLAPAVLKAVRELSDRFPLRGTAVAE